MNEEDLIKTDIFQDKNIFIHSSIPKVLDSQLKALLEFNQAKISKTLDSDSNQKIIQSILKLNPNPNNQNQLISNLKPSFNLESTTHVITNSLHLPEYFALGKSDSDLGDIISFSYSSQTDENQPHQIINRSIYLVTPLWVTQSYDLNKLQPTNAYSPDPYKFFSGIVVSLDTNSNLPKPDVELIQACVQAWGGQFRKGLTKEVTHLICCDENTRDYKIACKVKTQLGLRIVLPHWFHHSVFFRKIISETPFEFPSPSILEPRPTSIDPDLQHGIDGIPGTRLGLVTENHQIRKPIEEDSELELFSHQTATKIAFSSPNLHSRSIHQGLSDYLQETNSASLEPNQKSPINSNLDLNHDSSAHREFKNKSVYLVSSLGLSLTARRTLARRIEELGAHVFDSQDFIHNQNQNSHDQLDQNYLRECLQAENQLIKSDIVISDYRVGWEFWLAWELNKSIGTLHWILCILNNINAIGSIVRPPTERLLDFPSPIEPIHGYDHPNLSPITISNYTGSARSYLIRLIEKMRIGFSGSLDYKSAMVVAANKAGTKVEYATKRGIQIVNHYYIEECFQNWSKQSIQAHHLSFPDGVNLCESVGQLTRSIEAIHKWAKRTEVRDRRKLEMNQLPSKLLSDNVPTVKEPTLNNLNQPASPDIEGVPKSMHVQALDDRTSSQSAEIVQLNPPKSPTPVPLIRTTDLVQASLLQQPKAISEGSSSILAPISATETSLPQEEKDKEEESENPSEDLHQASSIHAPIAKRARRKPRLISNSIEPVTSPTNQMPQEKEVESLKQSARDSSPLPSITGLSDRENVDLPTPSPVAVRRKSPLKRSSNRAQVDSDDHRQSKKSKKKSTPSKNSSEFLEKAASTDTSPDQNNSNRVSQSNQGTEKEVTIDLVNNKTPMKVKRKKRSNSIDETPRPASANKKVKNPTSNSVMNSGSGSNTRTSSTRKAAQLALKNVKSAAEDMNLHQKETSRKSKVKNRSSLGTGELDLNDGGYFGRESKIKNQSVLEQDAQDQGSKRVKDGVTDRSNNKQKKSIGINNKKEQRDTSLNQKIERGSKSVRTKRSIKGTKNRTKDQDPNEEQDQVESETGEQSSRSETERDESQNSDVESISIELSKKTTNISSSPVKKSMDRNKASLSVKEKKINAVHENDPLDSIQKKSKNICVTQSGERIPVKLQNKLIKMGAKFIDSTPTIEDQCTHLLTTKIARTEKFLSCILLGCFIVNHDWAAQSAQENKFLDEHEFELVDLEGEKLHKFKLKQSINQARRKRKLGLKGEIAGGILNSFKFFLTPTVLKLNSHLLKKLILLAGGQVLSKLPPIEDLKQTTKLIKSLQKEEQDETSSARQKNNHDSEGGEFNLIISCKEDAKYLKNQLKSYLPARKDFDEDQDSTIKIYDSGLVLEGLLIQEIKFEKKYEIEL